MSTRVFRKKPLPYLFLKRLFDILFGICALILLIPVSLVVKIVSLFSGDFHSIFYSQIRIGKNGKPFKLYKIRTMVPNADGKPLEDLLKQKKYKDEWDKYQKFENDPRVTKIGSIIRHGSIDELPQALNILKGELSLIGPRPLVEGEIEKHHGDKKKYWSVKPGITGWWAVNGRSNTSYKQRFQLEYYYIDHQSLSLDTKIFFKTFLSVAKKDGAK